MIVDFEYYNALEDSVLDLSDAKEADMAKKEERVDFKEYFEKRFGKKV